MFDILPLFALDISLTMRWLRIFFKNPSLKSTRLYGSSRIKDTLKYLRDSGKTRFEELTADYQQPSDDVVERIPQEALFEMIRSLPDGYRTVFNLFVIEEKSYREISRLLKIKEGTVASQVYKAKALLAKKITDYERKMDR